MRFRFHSEIRIYNLVFAVETGASSTSEKDSSLAKTPTVGVTWEMDSIFREFGQSVSAQNGYRLARTLSPELSNDSLRVIWRSCNHNDVKNVLKRGIQNSSSGFERLPADQIQGWVEVYHMYWKAVGELLAVQEQPGSNGKVSFEDICYMVCSSWMRQDVVRWFFCGFKDKPGLISMF